MFETRNDNIYNQFEIDNDEQHTSIRQLSNRIGSGRGGNTSVMPLLYSQRVDSNKGVEPIEVNYQKWLGLRDYLQI